MKDIPMFTTEYGIASLVLKEIPYRQEAYVHIHDAFDPAELLRECISFCRMCGADKVYAAGHPVVESYPLHTAVLQMRGEMTPAEMACLWPVTVENVRKWREIYNERMTAVDNASTLTAVDERRILEDGGAYFVHDGASLLGIGWLSGGELLAIASVKPGAGSLVMQTILSLAGGEAVCLEVASTNHRAIGLYEKHGFTQTKEIRRWYCVNGQ